jgi:hypothetical protein
MRAAGKARGRGEGWDESSWEGSRRGRGGVGLPARIEGLTRGVPSGRTRCGGRLTVRLPRYSCSHRACSHRDQRCS